MTLENYFKNISFYLLMLLLELVGTHIQLLYTVGLKSILIAKR